MFFLGFISVLGYTKWNQKSSTISSINPIQVNPTPILLSPPSQALQGKLFESKGLIERIPWDVTTKVPATEGATLYQGDEVFTGLQSETIISVSQYASCLLKEKSDVLLGNLLPQSITIQHRSGIIQCTNEQPLTLRLPNLLLDMNTGAVQSTITSESVKVMIASGSATIGFVDTSNKTKIWRLQKSDSFIYDRDTNTLLTTGTLLSSD